MKMKSIVNITVAVALMTTLYACWFPCAPAICGTIKDKTSGAIIDSVKVDVFEGNELIESVFSDSTGFFQSGAKPKSVFMFSKCERSFALLLTKAGYKEKRYAGTSPAIFMVIELEK